MTSRALALRALWYDALHSPLGIYLRTPNPITLKTLLYRERQAAEDPALLALIIKTSPQEPEGCLWIVHAAPADSPA